MTFQINSRSFWSILLLAASLPVAAAQTSVNSTGWIPNTQTTSSQASLQDQIQAQEEAVRHLSMRLRELFDQLADLEHQKPELPRREDFGTEAHYQTAMSNYAAQTNAWQKQVDSVRQGIYQTKSELAKAEAQLLALLSRQAEQGEQVRAHKFRRQLVRFDATIDAELADVVLKREAELSGIQTRGTSISSARSQLLTSAGAGSRTSVTRFQRQTAALGIDDAIAHVEAVGQGATPNPELVAKAVLQSAENNPRRDVMVTLFMVFRQSIQETTQDKAYFLSRLQEMNRTAEAMADYIRQLNEPMGSGSGCNDDSAPGYVDTSTLDPDHRTLADKMLAERAWTKSEEGIAQTIRQLQNMQKQVQIRREIAAAKFENANQKRTQYVNMLASVMKTMNEMQSGIIRNTR